MNFNTPLIQNQSKRLDLHKTWRALNKEMLHRGFGSFKEKHSSTPKAINKKSGKRRAGVSRSLAFGLKKTRVYEERKGRELGGGQRRLHLLTLFYLWKCIINNSQRLFTMLFMSSIYITVLSVWNIFFLQEFLIFFNSLFARNKYKWIN